MRYNARGMRKIFIGQLLLILCIYRGEIELFIDFTYKHVISYAFVVFLGNCNVYIMLICWSVMLNNIHNYFNVGTVNKRCLLMPERINSKNKHALSINILTKEKLHKLAKNSSK